FLFMIILKVILPFHSAFLQIHSRRLKSVVSMSYPRRLFSALQLDSHYSLPPKSYSYNALLPVHLLQEFDLRVRLLPSSLLHIDTHNNSYRNVEFLPTPGRSLHQKQPHHRSIFYSGYSKYPLIYQRSKLPRPACAYECHAQILQTSFGEKRFRGILRENDSANKAFVSRHLRVLTYSHSIMPHYK